MRAKLQEAATERANIMEELAREKANAAKEVAEVRATAMKEALKKAADEAKAKAQAWMERKVDQALDMTKDVVKDGAKDPLMPNIVKKGIDKSVDLVWPEVKIEVMNAVTGLIRKKEKIPEEEPVECCPNPWTAFRAFVLYTLFPYNKSIWMQIRNPWFWVLKIISAFPRL
eukprot:TRINITY_DN2457_c2_g1_i4.p1 TRINITY_DN2457_c2_g1~~TRINITY_DN2457_c2_g1_i4.p1  ORF type:complete len:171 (+),score=61.12 TRINITY_DN2457_c2_g1_i4:456-968(+)